MALRPAPQKRERGVGSHLRGRRAVLAAQIKKRLKMLSGVFLFAGHEPMSA
jgi:hypothetical protein